MKPILLVPAAALLLAACTAPALDNNTPKNANAGEERYTPIGTYLPRKKGQTANNASSVDQRELENMKAAGAATNNGP